MVCGLEHSGSQPSIIRTIRSSIRVCMWSQWRGIQPVVCVCVGGGGGGGEDRSWMQYIHSGTSLIRMHLGQKKMS